MNTDRIECLARECIAEDWTDHVPGYYRSMNIERFAALVAEACAKACIEHFEREMRYDRTASAMSASDCAAAIRAFFKEQGT